MDEQYLKNEANALKVQKHQINSSVHKLTEIDQSINNIKQEQVFNNETLDEMFNNLHTFIQDGDIQLLNKKRHLPSNYKLVDELDKIKIHNDMTWEDYSNMVNDYGFRNNLNLKEDPFKDLMTESEKIELQKRIEDEFTFKNAQCDKYDYMIAGTCGAIAGIIDVVFVGAPGDSKLGNVVDKQANKITEKFASFLGWDNSKAKKRGSDTTKSAIGWLENGGSIDKDSWIFKILNSSGYIDENGRFKGFKVNYDQATTNGKNGTDGLVNNLSAKNHHLKSWGHSADIISLLISIFNQFTNTSTFISDGEIITIDTNESEINLQGHNFIAKIFCGFANWFGHIMSDWTGSSGAQGRGSGVPIPFYNLFLLLDFGTFGKDKQSFAKIATQVFEKGYEARHGIAMAIPVLINELLIRFMYTMKGRFYHQKNWEECLPKENIPELRRMLLVGHGVLCMIDGVDAYWQTKAKGTPIQAVEVLLRINLISWVRFGHLSLKEVYAWYNSGKIDYKVMDEYLTSDLKRILETK